MRSDWPRTSPRPSCSRRRDFIEEAIEEGGIIPLIPRIVLFSFTHDDCDPDQKQPALAELAANGDLILNIGDRAELRGLQVGEINEAYTLTALAPGVIRVDAFGISQTYGTAGGLTVKNVVGNAGSGNDSIKVMGVTTQEGGAPITFNLTGGDGDDWLEGNVGNDLIIGNDGSDTIIAREGDDRVFMHDQVSQGTGGLGEFADGGAGNDRLYGGANNDRLTGGEGDDLIFGGDGNDILKGEGGIDTIYGLAGDDEVGGGAANDNLYGGAGSDIVIGNDGKDRIFGDLDAAITDSTAITSMTRIPPRTRRGATLSLATTCAPLWILTRIPISPATSADDLPHSLPCAEFHLGGSTDDAAEDDDHIETNAGNDVVLAGGGNDFVVTGDGNDLAFGGNGNDEIRLGNDNDLAFGGVGFDLVYGEAGDDTINGGNDADILFGDFGEVLRRRWWRDHRHQVHRYRRCGRRCGHR